MAAFITELFFDKHSNNPNQSFKYETGWVTPGSGDEGVDFVGRLDIGNDTFANSSIIILGQSKRYTKEIKAERYKIIFAFSAESQTFDFDSNAAEIFTKNMKNSKISTD